MQLTTFANLLTKGPRWVVASKNQMKVRSAEAAFQRTFANLLTRGPRWVVASKNQMKVRSAEAAFQRAFPGQPFQFVGVGAPSGVPDQPWGDEETLRGARNRVKSAREELARGAQGDGSPPGVVALEGGVAWDASGDLECFAWAVVDADGREGRARSASFVLPPAVAELVKGGMELGDADDQVFNRIKSGQGSGTVGKLTGGLITRQAYYEHCVSLALIPFMNEDLYPMEEN